MFEDLLFGYKVFIWTNNYTNSHIPAYRAATRCSTIPALH